VRREMLEYMHGSACGQSCWMSARRIAFASGSDDDATTFLPYNYLYFARHCPRHLGHALLLAYTVSHRPRLQRGAWSGRARDSEGVEALGELGQPLRCQVDVLEQYPGALARGALQGAVGQLVAG